MKTARKLKFTALCAALAFLAGAVIIFPERYVSCCFRGFALWAECVLPSLFPFMVITLILIKTGLAERAALPLKRITGIFGLPPAAAVCLVMSLCSGYPAGAKALSEFYANGCLTAKDCKKLAPLCSTSGPLFIIGSVGVKMLNDKAAGWKILLAHCAAVIVTGLIVALFLRSGEKSDYRRAPADKNVLYESFYGAVISVAVAGGFIAFFAVAVQVTADFRLLLPVELLLRLFTDANTAAAVCNGIIEVTCGCRALAENGAALALPFAGFLITFGGLSIILQQLSYLTSARVSPAYFTAVKLAQAIICFLLLVPFIQ